MENNLASDEYQQTLDVTAGIVIDHNLISVYLHLKESYLDRAGASDNVLDSIDYSDLTKKVSNFLKAKSESDTPNFSGPDELIQAVTELAFDLAKETAAAVRVTVGAPKMTIVASKRMLIKDLILPVIIGINSAERKSKQRVKVNLIFHENSSSTLSTVVK